MLLLKPYLGCNLKCKYCYEDSIREAIPPKMEYDLEAIFKVMEANKELRMSLHGGEPLCLPKKDIEKFLNEMFILEGHSSVQTNGTLIDDDLIRMFKRYKTHVGISMDGWGKLNSYRMSEEQTSKLDDTISKLQEEKVGVSVLAVLSKANAENDDLLTSFKLWLLDMKKRGIGGRVNLCSGKCSLPLPRLEEVCIDLAHFALEYGLRWSPFIDLMHGLQGKDRVCTFAGCDIYHTPSAKVVLADGSITNCMRTNIDTITPRRENRTTTRDDILKALPFEDGGCKDCRFFDACHGGCPTTAIGGDWKQRTELCPVWKRILNYYSNVLGFLEDDSTKKTPIPGKPGWYHTDSGGKG